MSLVNVLIDAGQFDAADLALSQAIAQADSGAQSQELLTLRATFGRELAALSAAAAYRALEHGDVEAALGFARKAVADAPDTLSHRLLLANLPRPLWISVYDSANVGPDALVDGLIGWLPPDVGIFFQDGVGGHAREAKVARYYADVMSARLGRDRVRLIAEAFRPRQGGGFRSATAAEIRSQRQLYRGHRVYLFDAPHHVNDALITELAGPRAPTGR